MSFFSFERLIWFTRLYQKFWNVVFDICDSSYFLTDRQQISSKCNIPLCQWNLWQLLTHIRAMFPYVTITDINKLCLITCRTFFSRHTRIALVDSPGKWNFVATFGYEFLLLLYYEINTFEIKLIRTFPKRLSILQ